MGLDGASFLVTSCYAHGTDKQFNPNIRKGRSPMGEGGSGERRTSSGREIVTDPPPGLLSLSSGSQELTA